MGGEKESLDDLLDELIKDCGIAGPVARAIRNDFTKSPLRKKLSTIKDLEEMRDEEGEKSHNRADSSAPKLDDGGDKGMRIYDDREAGGAYILPRESRSAGKQKAGRAPPQDLLATSEEELDLEVLCDSWSSLLDDTVDDPEKRRVLDDSFNREPSKVRKYHMLLEFTSYLRKPDASPAFSESAKSELRRRRGTRPFGNKSDADPFVPPPSFERYRKLQERGAPKTSSFLRQAITIVLMLCVVVFGFVRIVPRLIETYEEFGDQMM